MNSLLISLSFQHLLSIMGAALGCGLLIGLERQRNNNQVKEQSFAGLRSFSICALLGALCFLIHLSVGIVGACAIIAFSIYGLFKQKQDIGSTTELAFVMTYFIGALCVYQIPLAAGLAVVLTLILMGKPYLHGIAGNWIKDYELRDGLFLLALLLIALPLMPNKPLWGAVLNPYVILKLLILILVVQSVAHIAKRLLSRNKALILSAVASGFVSSTATIASLGMEVRQGHGDAKSNAGAGLFSCVATLLQLLIIVAGLSLEWFTLLLLPCLLGITILMIAGFIYVSNLKKSNFSNSTDLPKIAAPNTPDLVLQNDIDAESINDTRMFSLKQAAIIALSLTLIQAAVYGLNLLLGDSGLIIGTLLASLFEVHAAMATVVMQGSIENMTLVYAIMIGLAAHACSKCINAWMTGGTAYFLYFAPIQILHITCVIAAIIYWV